MSTQDELERAVERLTARLDDDEEHWSLDPREDWRVDVPVFDLRLLLDERAELLTTVERMREDNRVLRAIPWPREYVLERASEWTRLLREVNGYIKTCRGSCGSDIAGRNHAIAASDKLIVMLSEARANHKDKP